MVDNRMSDMSTGGEIGRSSGRLEQVRHAVSDATHRARDQASHAAQRAGERAEQAIDQQKDRFASRLSRIANSMRDASHCFADNDEIGLGEYVELAADRLEEAGDYIQEHPFTELRHEGAMFLRRHPQLGLAGAFIGGVLLGRFLRASSSAERDEADEYGYGDEDWREKDWNVDEYSGSSAGSPGSAFAAAGAARAAHGPGRGVITPVGEATSSGPTSPGHAMAHGGTANRQGAEASRTWSSPAQSPQNQPSSRSDSGGEACAL